MPHSYTSLWGIDDGSCEQEAGSLKLPEGSTVVRTDYEYSDGKTGHQDFRIKVTYTEKIHVNNSKSSSHMSDPNPVAMPLPKTVTAQDFISDIVTDKYGRFAVNSRKRARMQVASFRVEYNQP